MRDLSTHCKHGHEYTPENTIIRTDGNGRARRCRTCKNESVKQRYWADGHKRVRPERTTADTLRAMCVRDASGCLLWTGFLNAAGYGRTKFEGRAWLVHRLVWKLAGGDLPKGLTLDHICHNATLDCPGGVCLHRRCVTLTHLRSVSAKVNTLAGKTIPARHAAKTHCDRGHPFTPENTYLFGPDKQWRACLTCREITKELRKHGIRLRPAKVG